MNEGRPYLLMWRVVWVSFPSYHAAASPGNLGILRRPRAPSGVFSAKIWFCETCLSLGTFNTTNEANRAYGAAGWHLLWPRRTLNFPNMPTLERTREVVRPRLITDEGCCDNRRREHHLGIAEMDEEAMALWHQCFPQDIINKRELYAQRRVEREKRRAERTAYREDKRMRKAAAQFNIKLGASSPWDSDNDRYLAAYVKMSEEDITE